MAAIVGALISVVLFFLTSASVSAEAPVSYSEPDNHSSGPGGASRPENSKPGMPWQIRPGEDILQIARLIYPENAAARDNLVRAIIKINPQHFPEGVYRPIPAGTTLHIPDLRMVSAYAKPAAQSRRSEPKKKSTQRRLRKTAISESNDHQLTRGLIAQLEQIADNETNQLNLLTQHIESMETQIAALQSSLLLKAATAQEEKTERTGLIAGFEMEPRAGAIIQPESNAHPIDVAAISESSLPPAENSADPHAFSTAPVNAGLFADTTLLLGILLLLLIIFMVLRSHKKIKQELAPSSDESFAAARHHYAAVLLQHTEKIAQTEENPPASSEQAMSAAHAFIEQEKPEAATELLQKQLAANQHDIPAWLMLFELLYKSNNKRDFKKNARRFKRMKAFPDIWRQIQSLGHRLEPNEPLYFDAQKRREKFFSGTPETG